MKNKYDFSFLLVEFKDLYKAINSLKEEKEARIKIKNIYNFYMFKYGGRLIKGEKKRRLININ